MRRLLTVTFSFAVLIFASGCTMEAPRYSASMENVQGLKNKNIGNVKDVSATKVDEKSDAVTDFSLRGSSMVSPYDGLFSAYLVAAVKQELSLAGKLSPDSNTEISCTLMKNNVDVSGFSTGTGDMQARFIVKRSGVERYNQVISAHNEWDSSFFGAVAIPKAQEQYPKLVQKLLANLYADQKFIQALK